MDMKTSPLATLNEPSLLKTDALIGGEWVGHSSRFDVTDPATGAKLADVANHGPESAHHAIVAANKAWPAWRNKTAKERGAILMKWFHLMHAHADDLARIMTAEQGKPLAEAKGEIAYGASFLEWYAEEARRVYGETIPTNDISKRHIVIKQAIGVCAAITPWNFPSAMITRKVAPALAAGCSVVVKPAEQTPLSALALAELAQRAGVPSGVLNILTADSENSVEIGKVLCTSDTVRHLSFTGSTEVGRILSAQCSPTLKKLSLELGGNAPFIVFEDCDIQSAIQGALMSKFRNAGQTCVCTNRILVQSSVLDEFIDGFVNAVKGLKVGNGFEPGVNQGPIIDERAILKIEGHIQDALASGAELVHGGHRIDKNFFAPSIISRVKSDMKCAKEESFGPIAPIIEFSTELEAIEIANCTDFGLASYIYSRDIARVLRVSEQLEFGMVGVNTGLISTAEVPFGGIKQSGLGREGAHQGIDEYLEAKYICIGNIAN